MTGSTESCVIVGGGHAAAQLCPALRKFGWEGEILLVSEEPSLPYHRPPLSKDYLKGLRELDQILIRRDAVYDKAGVIRLLGRQVVSVDREARFVSLDDGAHVRYDRLVLATGSVPRQLPVPGGDLPGVFVVRTARDVDGLREAVAAGGRAVVVGGGYIGLETAASLRTLGLEVTVVEALDRVLQRVTCPEMSRFFERIHREEGVEVRTGAQVTEILGNGAVSGVRLDDGSEVPAEVVVVGIGILPETTLAEAAGIDVDDGIAVDAHCRTSDERIFAAGDCTRQHCTHYDRALRLESVQNANDQATTAAKAICGVAEDHVALPWFWSDQYDVKLQIAGLAIDHDQVVTRGDPDGDRQFAAAYLRGGRLLAVDAANRPKDFLAAKKLIVEGAHMDVDRLGDPELPLTEAVLAEET
ncbi:MAG: FAD-dependent oxidoreductase [Pseudomonadota bacterium]